MLSPDYVDGRFFRVTLLTDERFADAALVFGGLSPEQMVENRKFLEPLPEGAELLTPPAFVEPPRLRVFASVATWGGLALESLIAVLCLIPATGRILAARHAALLPFCATTYALGAGRRLRLADRGDGTGAVPGESAPPARRLCGGVSPDPALRGNPLGRSTGELDDPLDRPSVPHREALQTIT